MKHILKLALFIAAASGLFGGLANAHPWGGLVIDEAGNIYFTFICPFVDDDHYACVWEIDDRLKLSSVLESAHSPSDIIIARTADRIIYGAERNNAGGGFEARLWKIAPNRKELIISPTTNSALFHIQAYVVSDDQTIFFGGDNRLLKRDGAKQVEPVETDHTFTRIDDMAWGPENRLYIIDRGTIKVLESTVGGGSWWRIWGRSDLIIPRVRKVSTNGEVPTIFEYESEKW